jgi:ribosomal protein L32
MGDFHRTMIRSSAGVQVCPSCGHVENADYTCKCARCLGKKALTAIEIGDESGADYHLPPIK